MLLKKSLPSKPRLSTLEAEPWLGKGLENYLLSNTQATAIKGLTGFAAVIVGLRPSKGYSIDRINNDGNYSCGKCQQCKSMGWPMNVKWSTKLEQDNNRRINVFVEFNGDRLSISQWARKIGMEIATLHSRFRDGWSVEESITEPVKRKSKFHPPKL